MRYSLIYSCIILAISSGINAQHPLPVNDKDWAESNEKVFLRDEVTEVFITMAEEDLDFIIANTDLDELKNCTVRFVNSVVDETITNVGLRARGNSARGTTKFPWKVEFNGFIDQKFLGLEKMNFNAGAVEPTISRETLAYDLYRSIGVAASRTGHIWLTINDGSKVQGVYTNVEQQDEEWAQAWFGNKDGDHYKCRFKDVPAKLTPLTPNTIESYENTDSYEEKITGSYQRLIDFINFIDTADDDQFRAEIKDYINIDSFLRSQAVDVAIGGWDGLWILANNYYLYYDTDTGVFEYAPWDLDNTFAMDYWLFPYPFGTNWAKRKIERFGKNCLVACNSGDNGPPLIDRILQIDEYYQVLENYVIEITSKYSHPAVLGKNADRILNLLEPLAYTGSFSGPTMDNGYINSDFVEGFDEPGSYSTFAGATWGIKPFLAERSNFIREEYGDAVPFSAVVVNEIVASNEESITDESGDNEDWVELYNDSDESIDLGGFFLTDRYGNPRQWEIPEGTVIEPHGFLLFWCDDDEEEGPLHTNFKLAKDGEGVYLYLNDPDLNILVSSIVFPELQDDQAYGRLPDGGNVISFLDTPTPSSPNKPNELTLLVDGFFPNELVVDCIGASPNASVKFLYSSALANFTLPIDTPCGGTTFGVDPTQNEPVTDVTDNTGRATVSFPAGVVPSGIYVQVIDVDTCETSNTVAI